MAADGTLIFDTKINTDGLQKFGKVAAAGLGAVTAAAGAAIGASVKMGMSFESSMSAVGATAMASAEDMEILSEKAQEMGRKTVFSASQAAEAMNYMAMAGWKTQEMTEGIEGIMNLAAASGEDLATTSDIVTDALTAFGMSASESGRLADVLAAASSNANTNVSMMGETFKYVAPVAGALGYSCEDMAVAIGLMANSGIKGSQAGTALRSTLSRMAKPTKEAASAMETLGLRLTDQNGNMKSFNEIMVDMRKGFGKLTKEQKASTAAALGGQEAMSGLLAIAGASEADFNKLTEAINNSSGAAKEMADRRLDNLQGKMTLLGSAAESLSLAVYSHMEQPLKDAAEAATDSVNRITESINSGALEGALENVGELFGQLVTSLIDLASVAVPKVISVLSFAGEHFDELARLVTSAAAGFAAFKAATAAAQAIKGVTIAISALATPVGAVAAVTGAAVAALAILENTVFAETEAEKKAREELEKTKKEREDYVGALTKQADASREAQKAQQESLSAGLEESARLATLVNELRGLADENGKVEESYRSRAQYILGELNSAFGTEYQLIDGGITKWDELKASTDGASSAIDLYIAKMQAKATLEALETDYKDSYANYTKHVEEQAYAAQKLAEARKEAAAAQEEFNAAEEKYVDIAKNAPYNLVAGNKAGDAVQKAMGKFAEAKAAVKEWQEGFSAACDTVRTDTRNIQNYQSVYAASVTNDADKINEALSGVISGAWDEAKKAAIESGKSQTEAADEAMETLIRTLTGLQDKGDEVSRQFVGQAIADINNALASMAENGEQMSQETAAALESLGFSVDAGLVAPIETAEEAVAGALTNMALSGATFGENFAAGISEAAPTAAEEAKKGADDAAEAAGDESIKTKMYDEGVDIGENLGKGVYVGIWNKIPEVETAAGMLADKATKAAKKRSEIKSPSRVWRDEIGKMLAAGLAEGITKNTDLVISAAEKQQDELLESERLYLKAKEEIEAEQDAYDEAERQKKYNEELESLEKSHEKKLKSIAESKKTESEKAEQIAEENAEYEKNLLEKTENEKRRLKEKADEEYLEQLRDTADKEKKIISQLKEDISALYEDIAKHISGSLGPVTDKLEAMKDKLRDYGDETVKVWSTTFEDGDKAEVFYHLGNFDEQISLLGEYSEALKTVKERLTDTFGKDIAEEFFSIMADMDVAEGAQLAKLLSSADDSEFVKYISDWKTARDLGEAISAELYEDEYKAAVDDSVEYMTKALEEMGLEVPEGFFASGTLSAEEFGKGFLDEMNNVLAEARSMVESFNASLSLGSAGGSGAIYNYSSSYTINGTQSTVRESIQAMDNQAAIERMRGY